MPYSFPNNIPRPAKNWTEEEQKKCIAAANAVLQDDGSEQQAIFACIRAAGKTQHPGGEGKATEEVMNMDDTKATWTTAFVNDLPDSSFLYIESGGEKDEEGKTKPRNLRHFPYEDAEGKVDIPHLRNALARIPQSNLPDGVKKRVIAKAQRIAKANGIEVAERAINWLDGADKAVIGGYAVLWGDQSTKDTDGEYFDATTDFWLGRWPAMPWMYHHGMDATLKAQDAVLGTVSMDKVRADDMGLWYEAQLDKAHRYYDAVAALIDDGLLGTSSGALPRFIKTASNGHVEVWPIIELSGTVAPADPRQVGDLAFLESAYKAIGVNVNFEGGDPMITEKGATEADEKKANEEKTDEKKAEKTLVIGDGEVAAIATALKAMLPEVPDITPLAAGLKALDEKITAQLAQLAGRLEALEATDDVKTQKRLADTGSGVWRAVYEPRKDGEKASEEDVKDGANFLRHFLKD